MTVERAKTIRIIRMLLTIISLFFITWYIELPEREWCMISVWFVMLEYTNIGGVNKKSWLRFIGTTASAVYGLFIIYFCQNNVIADVIAFIPAVFLLCHLFLDSDKVYLATIGCVTLTITLLNHNDVDAALLRTFNVCLGILASMFMIHFFYPEYAHTILLENQSRMIHEITATFEDYLNMDTPLSHVQSEATIRAQTLNRLVTSANQALQESHYETINSAKFIEENQEALHCIQQFIPLFQTFIRFITTENDRQALHQSSLFHHMLNELKMVRFQLAIWQKASASFNTTPTTATTSALITDENHAVQFILQHMHHELKSFTHAITNLLLEQRHHDAKKTA